MTNTAEKLRYAKRNGSYIWERESGYKGPLPQEGESILVDGNVYEIGLDIGDGHGATLTLIEPTCSYESISDDGRTWINDLRGSDASFPDVDPAAMTEPERDTLANYLRRDDGSLDAEDLEFSVQVADEIANLNPEQPDYDYDIAELADACEAI
jgi:hypothetical protein